jgi:hypothetical protein
VISIRPPIDHADAKKLADAIAARALNQLAAKPRVANRPAPKHPALNLPALNFPVAKARVAMPFAAIRLGATVVDPTAVQGRHVAAPMNRSHAPSRVQKLVGRKASGAMTTLSSSMTTMPTALAAAC